MSLRQGTVDIALPSAARGSGTVTSGALSTPGSAIHLLVMVHCTAASGTAPTLNVSLEQSNDGTTWTAVTGSGAAQLTAAGNARSNAIITDDYVRVTSTVAGTTPSFTYSVSVLIASE